MKRVLFAGYAPVHFVCFLPVYRQLSADPDVELFLSGGFRTVHDDGPTFSLDGFYDPFPVDRERVIPIEQARCEDFDVAVCAHLSDTLLPRSAGRTVQVFHGVSFKNLSVREKAQRYDLLCLPGRYHAERYIERGLVREDGACCLITGFPKTDALLNGGPDRAEVLAALGLDPERPTLLLAPTGEKKNALEVMGEDVTRAITGDGRWNLLVKPHDHPKNDIDWFAALAPHESDRMRLVHDKDVVPYLRAADLLLTDASSVAVEYTLLDRPIVFLHTPKLFKRVRKRAPAFDLETYGRRIGVVVKTPDDVVGAVDAALARPGRESALRRKMARHVFHAPGTATPRVAGVIRYAAGLQSDLPEGVAQLQPCGL